MALPTFSMRQLLEAGVHFGHQTHRWNPKMAPYIYGERSHIHILDLSQTVPLLHQSLVEARNIAAKGGRVLFVGTKRAASEPIALSAKRCAQYYVDHRWLGGMLTNWSTISKSIGRLRELEAMLGNEEGTGLTKKETLKLTNERDRLEKTLGGIKDMGGKPDLMFVVDTNKEAIAIKEARRLGIPVIAILDTNCDPDDADFPVPGNDDAARAISLYCNLIADAVLDGMTEAQTSVGVDVGASEAPVEMALDMTPPKTPAEAAPMDMAAIDPVEVAEEAKSEPVMAAAIKEEQKEEAKKPAQKAETAKKPAEKLPPAKKPAEKAPKAKKAAPEFVDDVSLIDGVGPTYKKKLEGAGFTSLKQIAELDGATITRLNDELNLRGNIVSGEWVEQAKDMIAGKPPRAKVDQAAAAKA